jgi:hypothetical protein
VRNEHGGRHEDRREHRCRIRSGHRHARAYGTTVPASTRPSWRGQRTE